VMAFTLYLSDFWVLPVDRGVALGFPTCCPSKKRAPECSVYPDTTNHKTMLCSGDSMAGSDNVMKVSM